MILNIAFTPSNSNLEPNVVTLSCQYENKVRIFEWINTNFPNFMPAAGFTIITLSIPTDTINSFLTRLQNAGFITAEQHNLFCTKANALKPALPLSSFATPLNSLNREELLKVLYPPVTDTPLDNRKRFFTLVQAGDLTQLMQYLSKYPELLQDWIKYNPNLNDPEVADAALRHGPASVLHLLEHTKLPFNALEKVASQSKKASSIEKIEALIRFGYGQDLNVNASSIIKALRATSAATPDEKKIAYKVIECLLSLPINSEFSSEIVKTALDQFPEILALLAKPTKVIISSELMVALVSKIELLTLDTLRTFIKAGAGTDCQINASALAVLLNSPQLSKKQSEFLDYFLKDNQIDWNYLIGEGTPLIHLAWPSHRSLIPEFCNAGADINAIDNNGMTLFHKILNDKHVSCADKQSGISILQACNANPIARLPLNSTVCYTNVTPYQLAVLQNQHSFAQSIAEYTVKYALENNIAIPIPDTIASQDSQLSVFLDKERTSSTNQQSEILAKLEQERANLQLKQAAIEQQLREKDIEIAKEMEIQRKTNDKNALLFGRLFHARGTPNSTENLDYLYAKNPYI